MGFSGITGRIILICTASFCIGKYYRMTLASPPAREVAYKMKPAPGGTLAERRYRTGHNGVG
jgi:hypothetical protein